MTTLGKASETGILLKAKNKNVQGSAALVDFDKVLTAHHCFEDDAQLYRFFLPGIGSFPIKQVLTTDEYSDKATKARLFCNIAQIKHPGAAEDLAVAILEKPVPIISPLKIPKAPVQPQSKVQICGFGFKQPGLRQIAFTEKNSVSGNVIYLGDGATLGRADSGGPITKNGYLTGVSLKKPATGAFLDKATLGWLNTCLKKSHQLPDRKGCLGQFFLENGGDACPGEDLLMIKKQIIKQCPEMLHLRDLLLTVTLNAYSKGRLGFDMRVSPSKPRLACPNEFFLSDPLSLTGPLPLALKNVHVWFKNCAPSNKQIQMFFSLTHQ